MVHLIGTLVAGPEGMTLRKGLCECALRGLLLVLPSACGETTDGRGVSPNHGGMPSNISGASVGATAGASTSGSPSGAGGDVGLAGEPTAGSPANGGQGGAATANPDVLAIDDTPFCGSLWTLKTSAFAPAAVKQRWEAVAAFTSFVGGSAKLTGGSRRFYSGGFIFEQAGQAWSGVPRCGGDGPFVLIAVDDDTAVSWSAGALSPSGSIRINDQIIDNVPRDLPMDFSGSTLLVGSDVYVPLNGMWGPAFQLVWQSKKVVGLGADRFARLETDQTEILQRVGMAWVSLGVLPPADAIAMAEDGARVALATVAGTTVYKKEAEQWVVEQSIADASDPSLTQFGDGYLLALTQADGVHVFGSGPTWSELDSVPLKGTALVRGGLLVVQTTNLDELMKLPSGANGAPSTFTVIYANGGMQPP